MYSKQNKVLVMHTGARDHYEVAVALHEGGQLASLVTNGYAKQKFLVLESIMRDLPGMSAFRRRRRQEIPDCKVISHLGYEIASKVIHRLWPLCYSEIYAWQELKIAKAAARFAERSGCNAVLSYNYCAFPLFKLLDGKGIKRLLFQCHPHPLTVKSILSSEIERNPRFRKTLLFEKEMSWGDSYVAQLSSESQMADGIIVASAFTKKSLVENGIHEEKIRVVAYGSERQWPKTAEIANEKFQQVKKFRILFVGQPGQRKGVSYLLDACDALDMRGAQLRICGRGLDPDPALLEGSRNWLVIRRNLNDAELAREFQNADVFVLPSLVEGFGLALIEAMSFGVPVITTPNGGGPDLIQHGRNGFIVPIRDSTSLAEILSVLREDPKLCQQIGSAAIGTARHFTWRRFRAGVRVAVDDLLDKMA